MAIDPSLHPSARASANTQSLYDAILLLCWNSAGGFPVLLAFFVLRSSHSPRSRVQCLHRASFRRFVFLLRARLCTFVRFVHSMRTRSCNHIAYHYYSLVGSVGRARRNGTRWRVRRATRSSKQAERQRQRVAHRGHQQPPPYRRAMVVGPLCALHALQRARELCTQRHKDLDSGQRFQTTQRAPQRAKRQHQQHKHKTLTYTHTHFPCAMFGCTRPRPPK